jgi:predicted enzyme related to lactoylglutathione lyase
MSMAPTPAYGKICYIEIPAVDPAASATFYEKVFGWHIRYPGDGENPAFDDGLGEVSGTWVSGRPPATGSGLLIYIMVDDAEAAVDKVVEHGGVIVQPLDPDSSEIIARFTDPAGNVFGIYQEPE